MKKIICLIPARANSKGVPGKNIRKFGGHPLISWSIVAALKSQKISKVVVSTDSLEYRAVAESYGAEVPFLRPNEISQDKSTDFEFIKHAVEWFSELNERPDIIVHLRPTSPLREPQVIDEGVQVFLNSFSSLTSCRSVQEMSESAYKTFEITENSLLRGLGRQSTDIDEFNLPRQAFPITYMANGYVDVLKVDHFMEHGSLHGDRCLGFLTNEIIEVDTLEDCNRLDSFLLNNTEVVENLFS